MFHIVPYQPEIPPVADNIIRLCANSGCVLHFVGSLGFRLDEPRLHRTGLGYHEWTTVREHTSLDTFNVVHSPRRTFAFSIGPGRDEPLRRFIPGGGPAAVQPGDERASGCSPGALPARAPAADPDPSGQAKASPRPGGRSRAHHRTSRLPAYPTTHRNSQCTRQKAGIPPNLPFGSGIPTGTHSPAGTDAPGNQGRGRQLTGHTLTPAAARSRGRTRPPRAPSPHAARRGGRWRTSCPAPRGAAPRRRSPDSGPCSGRRSRRS